MLSVIWRIEVHSWVWRKKTYVIFTPTHAVGICCLSLEGYSSFLNEWTVLTSCSQQFISSCHLNIPPVTWRAEFNLRCGERHLTSYSQQFNSSCHRNILSLASRAEFFLECRQKKNWTMIFYSSVGAVWKTLVEITRKFRVNYLQFEDAKLCSM